MPDFTASGFDLLARFPRSIGNPEFDARIHQLVRDWGCAGSSDLIQELIVTALKIGRDELSLADLKLFNRSLKELRHAARVFAPYADRQKIAVFGSARTSPQEPEFAAARAFGRKMREHGYMIITGGGDGIMGAAQQGAGREDSFGLNIRLPFEQHANEIIEGDRKLVTFNYFFTRKLNFVKEAHAVALFPGGFGTLDEGFEVLTLMQTGKARIVPITLVDKPGGRYWSELLEPLKKRMLADGLVSDDDFTFLHLAASVEDAVAHVLQFYKNFRSYRWVGKQLVVRLERPLSAAAYEELNARFGDLLATGRIEPSAALPEEVDQPELALVPRLRLTPERRRLARLRAFLDAVNAAELANPL